MGSNQTKVTCLNIANQDTELKYLIPRYVFQSTYPSSSFPPLNIIPSQVVEYAATGRVFWVFTLTSLTWHQVTTEEYAMGTICYQKGCKRPLFLLPSGKKTDIEAGPNTSAFSSFVWRRSHQPWHSDQGDDGDGTLRSYYPSRIPEKVLGRASVDMPTS